SLFARDARGLGSCAPPSSPAPAPCSAGWPPRRAPMEEPLLPEDERPRGAAAAWASGGALPGGLGETAHGPYAGCAGTRTPLEEPLVAPCRCRGTLRGVHASCIEAWLAARIASSASAAGRWGHRGELCDLCGAPYTCEHRPADNWQFLWAHAVRCGRWLRGACLSRRAAAFLLAALWLVGSAVGFAEPGGRQLTISLVGKAVG
ncbi:unnamed protein product, partial [Prorocentrum cordatum]